MERIMEPEWDQTLRLSGDESPVTSVVRTLSNAKGCDPSDLKPIQEVIDGDALNSLFQHTKSQSSSQTLVEFSHEGYEIQVSQSVVRVRENGV